MSLLKSLVPVLLAALLPWTPCMAGGGVYRLETVVQGLEQPWGLVFLPDGDLLVTEQPGRLRLIRNGKLQAEAVAGVPKVYVGLHGGLLDIALHPRFAENRLLFLSLAQGTDRANAMRVLRARYEAGRLHDVTEIYRVRPDKAHSISFGGRLLFLPDETLIVTVGDGYEYREHAQDLGSALGKIVRIKEDGRIPADNPFVRRSGARPEIWSYGHRNVLGLVRDPSTGTVYCHENAPWGGDELNIVRAGRNYGWPIATYGRDYSGAYVSPFKTYPGTEQPLLQWTPSLAPSGLDQCRHCQWAQWEGDLFAGMMAGKQVRRIRLRGDVVVEQETLFQELNEAVRTVRFGPDGALYLLTKNDKGRILRAEVSR